MNSSSILNRRRKMYLMQEALAREHMSARLAEAREQRRAALVARARRSARLAERHALRARLLKAQVI
ncbi:MAG: hypothetical protein GEU93_01705 [Propionibacteriales bacterium]|nr:hypothetical protein [Propionibacteriales bacterium]